MELVYLWVKEYKNIKGQGFNFSSSIIYKYDVANAVIEETENKQFIHNFFHESINITAIVGRNGSGKSSVFEILSRIQISDLNISLKKGVLCILKDQNKKLVFTNIEKINNLDVEPLEKLNENLSMIYHSTNFSSGYFEDKVNDFSTPIIHNFPEDGSSKNDKIYFKVQTQLNLLFNSNRFLVMHKADSISRSKDAFNIREMQNNYKLVKLLCILQFIQTHKHLIPFEMDDTSMVTLYIHTNKTTNVMHNQTTILDMAKEFFRLKLDEYHIEGIDRYMEYVNEDKYLEAYDKFIILLEAILPKNCENNGKVELSLANTIELMTHYQDLYLYNNNLENHLFDLDFRHLSSGEESYILTFLLLFYGIFSFNLNKNKNNKILIYLDEIENNLHPKWQKSMLYLMNVFLVNIVKWQMDNKKIKISFHLLYATHSSFILSDAPKQNIIFLDRNVRGECDMIDGLNDKKETFGSNIHTLLSDGFFMDDGLMGEFAKEKINDVYDFITNNGENIASKEEAQSIINLIGEPVIQKQLQILYDENFSDKNDIDSKIKRLELEIEDLKEKQKKK